MGPVEPVARLAQRDLLGLLDRQGVREQAVRLARLEYLAPTGQVERMGLLALTEINLR